jgi:long-chain acyl-CoA synthetase
MSEAPVPDYEEIYSRRPWLKHYPAHVPAEITPVFPDILAAFQRTVEQDPTHPALYYFDQTVTFGELDRQSNALAAALQQQGVRVGDRVALYLQNVPQFPIALYAIWKAGGIVVLCNPMFKTKELEYHLNDSGATGLICLEALYETVARQTVPRTAVKFVITTSELDFIGDTPLPPMLQSSKKQYFDDTLDLLKLVEQFAGTAPSVTELKPSDIAFLTYTSGTTGQPKGAMNTHANVIFNSQVLQTWIKLGRDDVLVGIAPFFHITGLIAHLTLAALAGMPIIICYRFDPAEVLRLTEKWQGTFTVGAITAFIALMEHPDLTRRDLSSLKKIYSGGAPIPPAVTQNFQKLTGAYIHNIYGLTETTSPSHAVPLGVAAPVDPATGALSVGVPVPGTECRIIDVANGQLLPPGEVGELLTRGPQIVAGYWQKPEETAHAIRDGFLHTGDVAKMDEDGWFYLVDRKKDMIIASGYKVWPREVEDVLYQHPAVREAAVVGVPDAYRGETVKAFVALKKDAQLQPSPEDLINFCKERMANYKYPRQVEILEELPKTLTGKFLRRELRK